MTSTIIASAMLADSLAQISETADAVSYISGRKILYHFTEIENQTKPLQMLRLLPSTLSLLTEVVL